MLYSVFILLKLCSAVYIVSFKSSTDVNNASCANCKSPSADIAFVSCTNSNPLSCSSTPFKASILDFIFASLVSYNSFNVAIS